MPVLWRYVLKACIHTLTRKIARRSTKMKMLEEVREVPSADGESTTARQKKHEIPPLDAMRSSKYALENKYTDRNRDCEPSCQVLMVDEPLVQNDVPG